MKPRTKPKRKPWELTKMAILRIERKRRKNSNRIKAIIINGHGVQRALESHEYVELSGENIMLCMRDAYLMGLEDGSGQTKDRDGNAFGIRF